MSEQERLSGIFALNEQGEVLVNEAGLADVVRAKAQSESTHQDLRAFGERY